MYPLVNFPWTRELITMPWTLPKSPEKVMAAALTKIDRGVSTAGLGNGCNVDSAVFWANEGNATQEN